VVSGRRSSGGGPNSRVTAKSCVGNSCGVTSPACTRHSKKTFSSCSWSTVDCLRTSKGANLRCHAKGINRQGGEESIVRAAKGWLSGRKHWWYQDFSGHQRQKAPIGGLAQGHLQEHLRHRVPVKDTTRRRCGLLDGLDNPISLDLLTQSYRLMCGPGREKL